MITSIINPGRSDWMLNEEFEVEGTGFRVACSSGRLAKVHAGWKLKLHLFINFTKMSSLSNYYGILHKMKIKLYRNEMQNKLRPLSLAVFVCKTIHFHWAFSYAWTCKLLLNVCPSLMLNTTEEWLKIQNVQHHLKFAREYIDELV